MMQTVLSRSPADATLLDSPIPVPGSPEELRAFAELQRGLEPMFSRVFADPNLREAVELYFEGESADDFTPVSDAAVGEAMIHA